MWFRYPSQRALLLVAVVSVGAQAQPCQETGNRSFIDWLLIDVEPGQPCGTVRDDDARYRSETLTDAQYRALVSQDSNRGIGSQRHGNSAITQESYLTAGESTTGLSNQGIDTVQGFKSVTQKKGGD